MAYATIQLMYYVRTRFFITDHMYYMHCLYMEITISDCCFSSMYHKQSSA